MHDVSTNLNISVRTVAAVASVNLLELGFLKLSKHIFKRNFIIINRNIKYNLHYRK